MGLRIFQGVDKAEIICYFVGRGRLEEDVRIVAVSQRVERVCRLGEGFGGYDGGSQRSRGVEVLQQGTAQRYDRSRRVYGYAGEQRKVLAAVGKSTEMCGSCVRKKYEGERGDVSATRTVSMS